MVDGPSSGKGAGCHLDGVFLILMLWNSYEIKAIVTDRCTTCAHFVMDFQNGGCSQLTVLTPLVCEDQRSEWDWRMPIPVISANMSNR